MEITAKYDGKCKTCGLPIHIGDRIDWERGYGASHVKCPAKENEREKIEAELEKIRAAEFIMPEDMANDDFIIKTCYHEGEYLSGYINCSGSNATPVIEKLQLGRYVSGWGMKIHGDVIKALGEEFTVARAREFAREKLETIHERGRLSKIKKLENELGKFNEAAETGKAVLLRQWSEDCNDWREECDIDNVYIYANPDGTTTKSRSHSW